MTKPELLSMGFEEKMREITGGKKGVASFKRVVPSFEPHHIISKAEGGSDEWDNLMALCSDGHKVLEARERKRKSSDLFRASVGGRV